jgi:hypothetical protein
MPLGGEVIVERLTVGAPTVEPEEVGLCWPLFLSMVEIVS